jgi:hypothetical protein
MYWIGERALITDASLIDAFDVPIPENKLSSPFLMKRGPKRKVSIGVVYVVYNVNLSLTTKFIQNTFASARSMKTAEPDLPITLMASPFPGWLKKEVEQVFTDIIILPEAILYPGRQWLTRIQAFSLTPYEVTISLDSDTFVCAPFSKDIRKAFIDQKLDLAFNGHDDYGVYPTHPDNGVVAYKYSARLKRLLKIWYHRSKQELTQDNEADDQGPLKRILLENPTAWKLGRLSPTFGTRFRPAEGEPWGTDERIHDHTLVLSGTARILHAFVLTYFNPKAVCSFINQRNEPRVVLFNRENYPLVNKSSVTNQLKIAYSLEECHLLLGARCDLESNWRHVPPIASLNEALRAIIP